MSAPLRCWIVAPVSDDVEQALQRLREAPDVRRVAVMPDVHLAEEVCVGTVVATATRIYPQAVGGDIGCGMSAIRVDASADLLSTERAAAAVLSGLGSTLPTVRHTKDVFPAELRSRPLSDGRLGRIRDRDGRVEFGTLGRGNHFFEFQRDEEGALWLMVHSGSRAMGPAIRDHHLGQGGRLLSIAADGDAGRAYLSDMAWAVSYAQASRRWMVDAVGRWLRSRFGVELVESTRIDCVHNLVRREVCGDEELWVHRKGAVSARAGEPGVIPGSMGSCSYHVEGRGCEEALCSSSHGAGRLHSRSAARRTIAPSEFQRQMSGVWFDHRLSDRLVEEAPGAYKDITRVMRAQRDLTRIVRKLSPLLSYKAP